MSAVRAFARRHPLVSYFILTFAVSSGGILVVAGPDGIPLPASDDPLQASPLLYTAMLAGPALAGIVMTGVVRGRAGFRNLLDRLLSWRVGVHWYAIALLTAPLLTAGVAVSLAAWFSSPDFLPALLTSESTVVLLLATLALGLIVGLLEELGWSGFAAPMLRQQYGVLATGLLLGFAWGAWHFLLFWESDSFSGLFPLVLLVVKLFSFLIAYRVLMVWVHDRTGSLLIAILMHAGLIAGLLPGVELPTAIIAFDLLFAAALWAIIGVLAAREHRSRRTSRQSMPQVAAVA